MKRTVSRMRHSSLQRHFASRSRIVGLDLKCFPLADASQSGKVSLVKVSAKKQLRRSTFR